MPVWQVWNRVEAEKVRTVLRDSGIPAFFGPEYLELEDFSGGFGSAVDVSTRNVDQHRALVALSQALPEQSADQAQKDEGAGTVSCPKCHSGEIIFQSVRKNLSGDASPKFRWRCDECGNQWEDDGVERMD